MPSTAQRTVSAKLANLASNEVFSESYLAVLCSGVSFECQDRQFHMLEQVLTRNFTQELTLAVDRGLSP